MRRDDLPGQQHLGVHDPEIPVVLESSSGRELPVGDVLGNDMATVVQLRSCVKASNLEDRAMYLCPECFVPLSLLSRRERRRFFFRHTIEDGRCTAVTRGGLSQDEIRARRYNGVKESVLHRDMKRWLAESLHADGRFTSIAQEQRWSGPVTGAWRKPDVSAVFNGTKVAFEVQLSTTFLDVIVQRRSFYLKEGGLLFWVFARFDEDARRLTVDDVFYNNNQNAFIVSQCTRDASVGAGKFLLDCVCAEPGYSNTGPALCRDRIAFDELSLDKGTQQAYFFDYARMKRQREEEQAEARAGWPSQFERWWFEVADNHPSLPDQEYEVWNYPDCVPKDWNDWGMHDQSPLRFYGKDNLLPVAVLNCFYSAKYGRPVGLNLKQFIQVAHYLAETYPGYLLWFRKALKVYDRGALLQAQDKSGKWAKRKQAYLRDMKANPENYEPDQAHQLLLEFLFPELTPLPGWPTDPL